MAQSLLVKGCFEVRADNDGDETTSRKDLSSYTAYTHTIGTFPEKYAKIIYQSVLPQNATGTKATGKTSFGGTRQSIYGVGGRQSTANKPSRWFSTD